MEIATTEQAIGQLTAALESGDVDVSGFETAFAAIAEGASFEEAMAEIRTFQEETASFNEEMNARFGEAPPVEVDVSEAQSGLDELQLKAEELAQMELVLEPIAEAADATDTMTNLQDHAEAVASGEYALNPIAGTGPAEADITRLRDLARETAGTYDVTFNVTTNGSPPGGGGGEEDNVPPPPTGYSMGGIVTGGVPGRDSVAALLTPGEAVIPESAMGSLDTAVSFLSRFFPQGGFAAPGGGGDAGGGDIGGVNVTVQNVFQGEARPSEVARASRAGVEEGMDKAMKRVGLV
jgi:hypothetical protein